MKRLLVANRGEIAVRIIRAARDLGISTVAVYSKADADALHTRLADRSVAIGASPASKSYLLTEAILDAARETGADAVHPGYGFLSERAPFAAAVADAGLTFVGPAAKVIERMGDKVAAREVARAAGVPTVPGTPGGVSGVDSAVEAAREIGYPVMIKAAAGGGGRGIRVVADESALRSEFARASQEAEKAFGDGTIYLERFVERARHVEVQVLGDGSDAVHLFERECSLQRRRQKVVEEAVSPGIPESVREEMTTAAVRLCREVGYTSAGTVEFLVDADAVEETGSAGHGGGDSGGGAPRAHGGGNSGGGAPRAHGGGNSGGGAPRGWFFIEMNTRIQVEHPTTELVTGVDLVAEQLRIAAGEPLRFRQPDVTRRGHAIEYRVCAEDPTKDFLPQPGDVGRVTLPSGPWVRCDTWLEPDGTVPPFYDSLLAKVVVWGADRDEALARSRRALDEFSVSGIPTTAGLLRSLVDEPWVGAADFHTGTLEQWLGKEST